MRTEMDAVTKKIEAYLKELGKYEQLELIIMNRQSVEIQTRNKLTKRIKKIKI